MIDENRVFGDYDEDFIAQKSAITIRLFPGNLKMRWSQCSILTDFLTAYFTSSEDRPASDEARMDDDHEEFMSAFAYVMNELIENAVKFGAQGNIDAGVGIKDDEIVVLVANSILASHAAEFQAVLEEITSDNPSAILVRRVEQNVVDDPEMQSRGAGLGLLTLMSDYNARLGWRFEPAAAHGDRVIVSTMARLPRSERLVNPG